jgi:hypothetical protein
MPASMNRVTGRTRVAHVSADEWDKRRAYRKAGKAGIPQFCSIAGTAGCDPAPALQPPEPDFDPLAPLVVAIAMAVGLAARPLTRDAGLWHSVSRDRAMLSLKVAAIQDRVEPVDS